MEALEYYCDFFFRETAADLSAAKLAEDGFWRELLRSAPELAKGCQQFIYEFLNLSIL